VSSKSQPWLASNSSSSSFYQSDCGRAAAITSATSSPVFRRHSPSTPAAPHFHWSTTSAAQQDDQLTQAATADIRTSSLVQVPDCQVYQQASPTTGFVGGPSVTRASDTGILLAYDADELAGDGFVLHDHYAVDEYSSTCKDGIRSYVDLMTSHTVLH